MNRKILTLFCVTFVIALFWTSSVQATLVGILEQILPTPTVYHQGGPGDPAPPGVDFSVFPDAPGTALGDVTALLQYVPGQGTPGIPLDFSNFDPGSIALIERGAATFATKVNEAEAAGAAGVLIANNVTNHISPGFGEDITNIPALFLEFELGQSLISLLATEDVTMHLAVNQSVPNPPIPLAPGMWNTRIIAIDDQSGATDHDIETTTEAMGILAYANGGPNTGGWNIRYDMSDNRNVIDMAGGTGTFGSDHPYPNGESVPGNSPVAGDDFLVTAETVNLVHIPEGDWTIGFGSDDGGALRIAGITFTAEYNTNGDPGLDDSIVFDAVRGHDWTTGEFTVGPGGQDVAIEAIMFERGGGDSFEIAIRAGHNGNNFVLNDVSRWQSLADGTLGWTVIPEPSTIVLCILALLGLVAMGRRR